MSEFVSEYKAAEMLGATKSAVRGLRFRNAIPAEFKKVNGRVKYRKTDIKMFREAYQAMKRGSKSACEPLKLSEISLKNKKILASHLVCRLSDAPRYSREENEISINFMLDIHRLCMGVIIQAIKDIRAYDIDSTNEIMRGHLGFYCDVMNINYESMIDVLVKIGLIRGRDGRYAV